MYEPGHYIEHECYHCGKVKLCRSIDIDQWLCHECESELDKKIMKTAIEIMIEKLQEMN